MPLGIGLQKSARLLQRSMLANAGDDILQRPAFGHMIKHVIHGDQRNKRAVGHVPELCQPAAVIAAIKQAGSEPHGAAGNLLETAKHFDQRVGIDPVGRHDNEIESFRLLQQIRKTKNAIALFRAILSDGQQTGETAPGGAIFRIGQNVGRAIAEDQARAHRDLEADHLRHRMRSHNAGDGVAVGDAETDEAQLLGAQDQLFGF